nr:HK97 family phage prohead protease [Rhizobium leucaenae]
MVGYALRWHEPAFIRDGGRCFEERFVKNAFTRSIAAGRVNLCLDHDRNAVVAKQSDGTLSLVEDAHGLRIDALAADTDIGDVALNAVRGRSRAGLSVGFERPVSRWANTSDGRQRVVIDCDLIEVSIVRNPAYPSGEVHTGKMRIDAFEARWRAEA